MEYMDLFGKNPNAPSNTDKDIAKERIPLVALRMKLEDSLGPEAEINERKYTVVQSNPTRKGLVLTLLFEDIVVRKTITNSDECFQVDNHVVINTKDGETIKIFFEE